MRATFVYSRIFDSEWKRLGFGDEDLRQLELQIMQNPNAGRVIQETNGVRKLRFARPGKGKSGGCRVIYAYFPQYCVAVIAFVYGKNERDNLTSGQKSELRRLVRYLEGRLAAGGY